MTEGLVVVAAGCRFWREMLEVLREGGPRNRVGLGGREAWKCSDLALALDGESVDMLGSIRKRINQPSSYSASPQMNRVLDSFEGILQL